MGLTEMMVNTGFGRRREGPRRAGAEGRGAKMFKVKKCRRRPGFTLLEVLIATVVVGVGFLAAASMQGTSISGNSRSNYMTQAVYLAEDKIEELRNTTYINVSALGSPENSINEMGNAGGIYTRSWAVVEGSMGALTKSVTVTVTWRERGVNHSLTMTTVIIG